MDFDIFVAFVQDDNDVQYLLDNMPISMHKVSKFPTRNVYTIINVSTKISTRREYLI